MMIDINKKYRTRDGRPVELITTRGRDKWPVMGYIGDEDQVSLWSIDGSNNSYSRLNVFDLVEAKPKRVLSLNVYPDDEVYAHGSREDAEGGNADDSRIACLKIEFEEGEGL